MFLFAALQSFPIIILILMTEEKQSNKPNGNQFRDADDPSF